MSPLAVTLCSRLLTSIFLLTLTTAVAFITASFSCCFHNQESLPYYTECGLLSFSIIQHVTNRAVCGFVRRWCFSCWSCETCVQTGVLHWKHGEVPWAAGRHWYWQVCFSHTWVGLPDGSCSGLLQSLLLFFSIIMKVKQHEEFFPAFHALVTGILQTLGKFNQLYLFYLQMTSW